MIHTPENSKGKVVVDSCGNEIKYATSFNDVTEEVTFLVIGKNGRPIVSGLSLSGGLEFAQATVVIKGAKLKDKA